jgi:hypothetical protein
MLLFLLGFFGAKVIFLLGSSGISTLPADWTTTAQDSIDLLRLELNLSSSMSSQHQARIAKLEQDVYKIKQLLLQTSAGTSSPLKQLPTCESLMKRPGTSFADGTFLTRSTTPNAWTIRADGSRQLELPFTCHLKRYASSEAKQCLSNRHMSFIGDSITRYQFLSLVHFVELGQYPPRFGRSEDCKHIDEQGNLTCSPWDEPNVCMEQNWVAQEGDPWQHFHTALGGSLDGAVFRGRLQCACARRKPPQINGTKPIENALYVSEEFDTGSRVKISYISEIGWGVDPTPVHGWNFTDCAFEGKCRTTKDDSEMLFQRAVDGDFDWNEPLYEALNGTLRSILPPVDIAIYNRGLWGILGKERAQVTMPVLREFVGEGRCFYRTITAAPCYYDRNLPNREMMTMKEATFKAGCGMLDFAHLTKEFNLLGYHRDGPPKQDHGTIWNYREWEDIYWDNAHFNPWVYEELNNVLLNVLCNGP